MPKNVSTPLSTEQLLTTAIDGLAEHFILFDREDRIVMANKAWKELNQAVIETTEPGVKFEDHLRALLEKGLVPEAVGREIEWLQERMGRHNNPGKPFEVQRQDGRWILVNEQRLPDDMTVLIVSDITRQKKVEAALRESEERFRDITDSAGDWFWEMGPDLRFSYLSDRFFDQFQLAKHQIIGKTWEEFSGTRRRDSRWEKHLRDLTFRRPFRDFEYAVTVPHGNTKHIRICGKPLFDGSGSFSGYRGSGADITQQRKNQILLETIIEHSPTKIHIKDTEGRYLLINNLAARLFGVDQAEALGKTSHDLFSKDVADAFKAHDQRVLESGTEAEDEENFALADEMHTFLTVKFPIFNAGETVGIGAIGTDISERKQLQRALEEMAHHDALTGLPNRNLFNDRLDRAIAMAKRLDNKIVFLYLDLDGFKPINDSLGHDVGDLVLQEVARRLTTCMRETDTVARLGGDEFAILLAPPVTREAGKGTAERVRTAMSAPITVSGHSCTVGVSIGISVFPDDAKNAETLIKLADAAMYAVKGNGRNGFRFYTDDPV